MYSRELEGERDLQESRKLKAAKKLRRKQALFLKEEPQLAVHVSFVGAPSQAVFIGNGGLQNGLSREVMVRLLGRKLQELCMPVGKDYAFANFEATSNAAAAVELLNGACVQELCRKFEILDLLGQPLARGPPLHLYVCYVEIFPGGESAMNDAAASEVPPAGLFIVPEFISDAEETCFLDFFGISSQVSIDHKCGAACTAMTSGVTCSGKEACSTGDPEDTSSKTENPFPEDIPLHHHTSSDTETRPPQSALKHRRVMHYGYEFLYASSNVDPDSPLPGGLPSVCIPMLRRAVDSKLVSQIPDQLTVNEYPPGAGIPPHVDTHSAFADGIMSLSLGSSVVMEFRHPDGRRVPVFLQRRSLLVMTGESRYLWTHGIATRKTDVVKPGMPGFPSPPAVRATSTALSSAGTRAATVLPRGTRVSLTFRKVQRSPCSCCYPLQCDSQDFMAAKIRNT